MKNFTRLLAITAVITAGIEARAENPKEFTVKSATDDTAFKLSEHKGRTVVLHFLLKTECPYCQGYTHDYAALAEKQPDVVHVFLKPDTEEEIQAWSAGVNKRDLARAPVIYRDPNAKLAKQYKVPGGYSFHGQTMHYPALIALDGTGKELFRYVGKSNADRMSVKDFEAKLAKSGE